MWLTLGLTHEWEIHHDASCRDGVNKHGKNKHAVDQDDGLRIPSGDCVHCVLLFENTEGYVMWCHMSLCNWNNITASYLIITKVIASRFFLNIRHRCKENLVEYQICTFWVLKKRRGLELYGYPVKKSLFELLNPFFGQLNKWLNCWMAPKPSALFSDAKKTLFLFRMGFSWPK